MSCRLLLKNQCRCSCSRMEPSAWIKREPYSRMGTVRQPAEPACAPDPVTAATPPSRWGAVWKQPPRSNRNIPLDYIPSSTRWDHSGREVNCKPCGFKYVIPLKYIVFLTESHKMGQRTTEYVSAISV